MAVPKKKTSKSKKNSRKSMWKKKVFSSSLKALSLAKIVLSNINLTSQYFGFSTNATSKLFLKKSLDLDIEL
jgi:large subunit ribosomal protein L32